jgi:ribose transport system permease protein
VKLADGAVAPRRDTPIAPPRFSRNIRASREVGLLVVLAATAAVLTLLHPDFLQRSNLISIGTGMIYDLPLAAGMTLVLIVGAIDLSVGAVLALSGVVITLMLRSGWPMALAVASGVLLAAGIGALNGLLITRFRLPAFIVTLGTMSIARGAAVVLTSGYMVSGLPSGYVAFGRATWLDLPVPMWALLVLLGAGQLLLSRWQPLHDVFYVGHNREAARLCGLPVTRLTVAAFVVSGVCAAVAAIFMTSRMGMGYARFGELAELRAIAAAVLGGASFTGGSGSVTGAALGVLLLAVILNGFVLLNLSIYWQSLATGLILIVAVATDTLRRGRYAGETA